MLSWNLSCLLRHKADLFGGLESVSGAKSRAKGLGCVGDGACPIRSQTPCSQDNIEVVDSTTLLRFRKNSHRKTSDALLTGIFRRSDAIGLVAMRNRY